MFGDARVKKAIIYDCDSKIRRREGSFIKRLTWRYNCSFNCEKCFQAGPPLYPPPLTGPVSKTSYNPWPWTPECESMIPMQFTTVIATWWCIKTNIQNAGTEEENWNGMQLDHSPHRRLGRGRTPTFLEGSITEVGCIRKHIPIPDWLCIWRTLIPLTRFSVYTVNLHFFSVSLPI